jgi:hypothetical protein
MNRNEDDKDEAHAKDNDPFGLDILKHQGDSDDLGSIGKPDEWKRDPILLPSPGTPSDLDSAGNYPIPSKDFYGEVSGHLVQFSIAEPWVHQQTKPDWSPDSFPSTLSEFRAWWDTLEQQRLTRRFFRERSRRTVLVCWEKSEHS